MNFSRASTRISTFFFLFFSLSAATGAQSIYELRTGTIISLRMDNEINSEVSSVKDTFTATVSKPVYVREAAVLPAGAVIEGRVTQAKSASPGGRNGRLEVVFETLRLRSGEIRRIEGRLVKELAAESSSKTGIFSIVGGAALGALIGGASKAGNGAVIGAAIGGGAGTGIALARKGKDVGIKADEEFEIRLTKDVTLPVEDF